MNKESIEELKNSLTIEQIYSLLEELGGEPIYEGNSAIRSKTICHCGDSHKLYYYENTHLLKCFTGCDNIGAFDIFELVIKVKSRETNKEWTLGRAISFIASFFNIKISTVDFADEGFLKLNDWELLKNYDRIKLLNENKQIIELKKYSTDILKYLPRPRILPWEEEGIKQEVMNRCGICYDPVNEGIVIPHYNINNELVGIRERTLIKENETYGKYLPAKLNGMIYNHPLSFNLYNLNNSKDNIRLMRKAVVFESEKSTLLYQSYFGIDNDISVACCGSSLITYQVQLLLSLGVEEIIVAFDRQYEKLNNEEHKRWVKKLKEIYKKYSSFVQISFMFDTEGLLDYKMSPIDNGANIFLELYKRRIML